MTHTTELERLMAEATPLPWVFQDMSAEMEWEGEPSYNIDVGDYVIQNGRYYPTAPDFADAALIVAAVNALPELLALRKENERLKAMANTETKGSLPWWVQQAAMHAEDMGEEGFLIDRDHWERVVFTAQTEVARAALSQEAGS